MTRIVFPEAIEEMFKDFITKTRGNIHRVIDENTKFIPRADVWETEKEYVIQVMVPGVSKEDINIEFTDGILTVSGERSVPNEEGIKFHLLETPYGKYERAFRIPENVEGEKISAEYSNGILKLVVPKKQKEVKKISVKVK